MKSPESPKSPEGRLMPYFVKRPSSIGPSVSENDEATMPLGPEPQLFPDQVPDPVRRDLAVPVVAIRSLRPAAAALTDIGTSAGCWP